MLSLLFVLHVLPTLDLITTTFRVWSPLYSFLQHLVTCSILDSHAVPTPKPQVTADNLSEFWGFRGGKADESVLLGYDAATMRNWIPTFRRDVMPLSSSVANYTTFPLNVGIRLQLTQGHIPKERILQVIPHYAILRSDTQDMFV